MGTLIESDTKAQVMTTEQQCCIRRWWYHSWQPRTKEWNISPICSGNGAWGNCPGFFRGKGGKGGSWREGSCITPVRCYYSNKQAQQILLLENVYLHGEIKQSWAKVSHNLGGRRAQGPRGLAACSLLLPLTHQSRGAKQLLANNFPVFFIGNRRGGQSQGDLIHCKVFGLYKDVSVSPVNVAKYLYPFYTWLAYPSLMKITTLSALKISCFQESSYTLISLYRI